jgi:hypothetical protein
VRSRWTSSLPGEDERLETAFEVCIDVYYKIADLVHFTTLQCPRKHVLCSLTSIALQGIAELALQHQAQTGATAAAVPLSTGQQQLADGAAAETTDYLSEWGGRDASAAASRTVRGAAWCRYVWHGFLYTHKYRT